MTSCRGLSFWANGKKSFVKLNYYIINADSKQRMFQIFGDENSFSTV
jgi:hypothetical protein